MPQPLIILASDRVAVDDVVHRVPDADAGYEIVIDRRWHERRRAKKPETPAERRGPDRRQRDVRDALRSDGYVFIPAEQRGGQEPG